MSYPDWVCVECGERYGNRMPKVATWHNGVCGVCGQERIVTEPRDFGHLNLPSASSVGVDNVFNPALTRPYEQET